MNFLIYTLGCKVNAYESEFMKEKLLAKGYIYSEENPDIIIINTCSVTNMADSKSKKMVRHFKRKNPKAIMVVCGCSSQNKFSQYKEMGIDILIGNKEKSKIVNHIETFRKNKQKYEMLCESRKLPFEDMKIDKFTTHTRAFVKIQDGCDNFCSYCVIPLVRGSIRSKKYEFAMEEIKTLVKNGHKEIVLTGIHTGSYGYNEGYDLTDLIHEMSKLDDLKRIRVSSIEITELNDKFLKELKENKKICDHLHIPLQAGSDEILRKMNRKYDLKYYEEKIKKIREIRPDISITTDIIVGFPSETDELFECTCKFAEKINFSKIHVFPYSKREGTLASRMNDQVDENKKKERSKRLVNLSLKLEREYAKKFLNTKMEVLVENDNFGSSSNYLKIKLLGEALPNTLIMVFNISYVNGFLIGKI